MNGFRQLFRILQGDYFKLVIYLVSLVSLVFLTNDFFVKTALAQSSDSSQDYDDIEVFFVDELQAQNIIDQLSSSSYDHVAVEELSGKEAQALLEHSAHSLSYSVARDDFKDISQLSCGAGSFVGLAVSSVYIYNAIELFVKKTVQFSARNHLPILVVVVPAGLAGGCAVGFVASGLILGTTSVFSYIFDRVFPGKKDDQEKVPMESTFDKPDEKALDKKASEQSSGKDQDVLTQSTSPGGDDSKSTVVESSETASLSSEQGSKDKQASKVLEDSSQSGAGSSEELTSKDGMVSDYDQDHLAESSSDVDGDDTAMLEDMIDKNQPISDEVIREHYQGKVMKKQPK